MISIASPSVPLTLARTVSAINALSRWTWGSTVGATRAPPRRCLRPFGLEVWCDGGDAATRDAEVERAVGLAPAQKAALDQEIKRHRRLPAQPSLSPGWRRCFAWSIAS
jgi:hypothetical protein